MWWWWWLVVVVVPPSADLTPPTHTHTYTHTHTRTCSVASDLETLDGGARAKLGVSFSLPYPGVDGVLSKSFNADSLRKRGFGILGPPIDWHAELGDAVQQPSACLCA